MNILLVIFIMALGLGALGLRRRRHVFVVPEGCAALLYCDGQYIRRNNVGRRIIWGRGWTTKTVDLRKASLPVPGQEVLTADNVSVKVSVLVTYQITDPARAHHETQDWHGDLYASAQMALRATAAGLTVEAWLHQRPAIGAQILSAMQPEVVKIGLQVHAVEVRDFILPPALKQAFADVLKARQEGQAALERARGEHASLRCLANAARVLEGNPALMNLRLMQSVTAAQKSGNTLVLGVSGGFTPLKNGSTAHAGEIA